MSKKGSVVLLRTFGKLVNLYTFLYICRKKNYEKYLQEKVIKKTDSLEDLKMLLLNFNFVMIYIIHKMSVLIKNNLNYLKDSIFDCFYKEHNRLLFLIFLIIFFIT